MPSPTERRPSAADRVGIWIFTAAGIVLLAWSAFAGLMRIMHLLLGEDVPFAVAFPSTTVETQLTPDGAPVALQLDSAQLVVRQMTPLGFWSAVLEQVLLFAAIAIVILCLLALSRRALRGEIFSRRSTALVATAGLAGLIGAGLARLLGGIAGAEALLSETGSDINGVVIFTVQPLHFVIAAFIIALVVHAYTVGSRMQHDTEGLI